MSKRKKPKPPSQMDRARAARAAIETRAAGPNQRQLEMQAFLSIFHPDLSDAKARSIVRDVT